MGVMHNKAIEKIRDNAPDGAMSYPDCRLLMSRLFHINGKETKKLLNELRDMGLVQLGNHGFKIKEDDNVGNNRD